MPHGFFTIEQWQRPRSGAKLQWLPVLHLDASQSLTHAIRALEKRGQAGLYRVVQTQRCLWGEQTGGKLKFHGSHVSSPEGLAELAQMFDRERGRRPVEKARQARLEAKARRTSHG